MSWRLSDKEMDDKLFDYVLHAIWRSGGDGEATIVVENEEELEKKTKSFLRFYKERRNLFPEGCKSPGGRHDYKTSVFLVDEQGHLFIVIDEDGVYLGREAVVFTCW